MQYRGKPPPSLGANSSRRLSKADAAAVAAAVEELNPWRARQRQLQQRFDAVSAEVAEREEFVCSMQQLGKYTAEHKVVITGEIATRVQELERLDAELRKLQIRAAAAAATVGTLQQRL